MDIESSSEPDSATITWQIKRAASDEGMPIEKNRVEVDREGEESQFSEPIIDNVILQPSDIEALLAARDDHTAATPSAEAVVSSDLEWGLNSKYKELVQILDQIIDLLEADGEAHWLEYMTTTRKLLLKADRSGIEHLLGAYGGMGSFNDLVIGQSKAHGVFQRKPSAQENNGKLASLRSRAYELAGMIR